MIGGVSGPRKLSFCGGNVQYVLEFFVFFFSFYLSFHVRILRSRDETELFIMIVWKLVLVYDGKVLRFFFAIWLG